jgi:hypothetical protein
MDALIVFPFFVVKRRLAAKKSQFDDQGYARTYVCARIGPGRNWQNLRHRLPFRSAGRGIFGKSGRKI